MFFLTYDYRKNLSYGIYVESSYSLEKVYLLQCEKLHIIIILVRMLNPNFKISFNKCFIHYTNPIT